MKEETVEYRVKSTANRLNKLIGIEIKRKTFSKQNNISGEYSENGGFDLYNHASFIYFRPNHGPIVKLNLKSVNSNRDGTESKLTLKKLKGMTYKVHFWFAIFFVSLSLILTLYLIFTEENNEIFVALLLSIFGLVYLLIIEFIANKTVESLIKRVEKIMTDENTEYKKL